MIDRLGRYLGQPEGDTETDAQELARKVERAQGAFQDALDRAGAFVAAHPFACLGVAAGAGITLGWWVKRK
jgi:ElaB/YqjD/DUF883 family membrane-anchored ribosome-binding protein